MKFKLSENYDAQQSSEFGLRSNVINCIATQGDKTTWIGTGQGISVMHDSVSIFTLDTMHIIDDEPRFIFDSIASMTSQDSILVFAITTRDDGDPIGTGIYISKNVLSEKIDWYRYDQPIDSVGASKAAFGFGYFEARPLIGTRGVVSYSMDIQDRYLWITSWYGGLRRFDLVKMVEWERMQLPLESLWERVPLPLDSTVELITCDENKYSESDGRLFINDTDDYYWDSSDPDGNNNHKTFSVLAYGDTVWVGTANGANRGIIGENGCVDWKHYYHPNDNLSGNWVLGLAKQEINNERIIWAITVNALLETEERGISFTRDDGETWEIVQDLKGIRCHDISILGQTILVASDDGLWKSDNRDIWELIEPAVEATPVSTDEILSNTVYSVRGDDRDYFGNPIIWIGTPDGLARSYNIETDNWQIYRAISDKEEVYAYPNPFSPYLHNQLNEDGWVRFNTGDSPVAKVKMEIFNFGLEKIYSKSFDWQVNPGAVKWNGRDENGNMVANGVYFIKLNLSDEQNDIDEEHWIKLVVVK